MWHFHQPTDIFFGLGEIKNIKSVMELKGLKRALAVVDPFSESSGTAGKIQEYAEGLIIGIASDVEANPSIGNVDSCLAKARAFDIDGIVAIGGGSAMDCAKSTAAAFLEDCSPEELLAGKTIGKALPVIAVPTTAGTGSEVSAGAVLSDKERGIKQAIFGPALFPVAAIVDPELTVTCPPKVTATTGIDILAHAMDALTSKKHNPASDALAVRAIRMVFDNLERACADGRDLKARSSLSAACTVAGQAFSQTGTTGSHACSYILTSKYGIPHGEACALTLDEWFLLNTEARPEINSLSASAGFENAADLCAALNDLKKSTGLRCSLDEMGIPSSDIQDIVSASAASGNMKNNLYSVRDSDILRIVSSKK